MAACAMQDDHAGSGATNAVEASGMGRPLGYGKKIRLNFGADSQHRRHIVIHHGVARQAAHWNDVDRSDHVLQGRIKSERISMEPFGYTPLGLLFRQNTDLPGCNKISCNVAYVVGVQNSC